MRISVVIPALNEEKYITGVLSDLRRQTRLPDQIVVVDGKSDDQTVSVVSEGFVGVDVVVSAKRGPGLQRTLGGRQAFGDLLVFLDADVRVDTLFLENVERYFKNRSLGIAGVRYIPHQAGWPVRFFFFFFNSLFFLSQWSHPSAGGSCIICTKQVFELVGGFVEDNPFDDIIFVRHAARQGRFAILPLEVFVSDRRFRKYGLWYMWKRYLLLSWYFFWEDYEGARRVDYEFGKF